MNYQLEMNYHQDVMENIRCLTLSIGADNQEEFKWIADNLDLFRTESANYYYKILERVLSETNTQLYVVNSTGSEKGHYEFKQLSTVNEGLSFFNKYNNHLFLFLKNEDKSLQSCIFKDILIEMYNKGYSIFKLDDFYTEGNSVTFYSKNKKLYDKLKKIAEINGFHMLQ